MKEDIIDEKAEAREAAQIIEGSNNRLRREAKDSENAAMTIARTLKEMDRHRGTKGYDKALEKGYREWNQLEACKGRGIGDEHDAGRIATELLYTAADSYHAIGDFKKAKRMAKLADAYAVKYDLTPGETPIHYPEFKREKARGEHKRIISERFGEKGEKRLKALENRVAAVIGIVGISLSIIFLSNNFTGNAIGANQVTSNWIGGVLFVVGLAGAFYYFKKK